MNQNSIVNLSRKKKYLIFFIALTLINITTHRQSLSIELNLLCIKNDLDISKRTIKDLIIQIDTDSKDIKLGGLNFKADNLKLTETNLKWDASNVLNLYPDSSGFTSGTLGRFSGELNLFFKHDISLKRISLSYKCEKYKLRNRKF